jgi:hypothetical protein
LGAFPALLEKSAGNRAFRSNLVYPFGAHKYFRFNPLRGRKPALFVKAPEMRPKSSA